MMDPTLANKRPILPTPRCKEWPACGLVVLSVAVPVWVRFPRVRADVALAVVRLRTNPAIFGVTSGDAISVSLRLNN